MARAACLFLAFGVSLAYMTNIPPLRVLVVEDEDRIRQFLQRGLTYEGYRVDVAADGQTGLTLARENPPDLVILDWMLPGMDGLEVCRRLRAGGPLPIVMLTAKDSVSDRVQGLDAGADDYLVKPFAFDELLARMRALLRRAAPTQIEVLRYADLTLDTGTRQAFRGERAIELTAKEYELLELFLRHPRQVLTRELIFDRVWGYDFGGESNIIEVYVRYLRQKLEEQGEQRLLHTVRSVGYVLRED
jgi:two-component system response regulator MprA